MTPTALAESVFLPSPVEPAGETPWLSERRRRAFARFEELGFPTPHDESWRYTGIQAITGTPWTRTRGGFELSGPAPEGVRVHPLREALVLARPFFDRIVPESSAFSALNAALLDDATVVEILPGAVVAEPLELVFRAGASAAGPVLYSPRLLVVAGERSEASIVQRFEGGGGVTFTNAVTEIDVAAGAVLEHTLLQRESREACHVHGMAAKQARGSRFTSVNVALGSALARTDLDVVLADEGAECALYGLFVGGGTQHLDVHTTIDHARPHCTSRELYKGILDGAARGVFHGKIVVRPDAQKTDAVQTNKNLLLSRHALVNSTPALEILADDVKCKHGSTTGQLDAGALFYLRSRGIGEEAARSILTWAFAADVAERIRIPGVRAEVERELGLVLSGSPAEGTA
jgi:Fe-S cluster assembly protein SufD